MSDEFVGQLEVAVLDAVHTGALRPRHPTGGIRALRSSPAATALLHDALHRCERDGLLRSRRDLTGRRYELTGAGRSRLRTQRRFALALATLLSRSISSRS